MFDIKKPESNLPPEIKEMRRFLLWRYEMVGSDKRKVPYREVGRKAASNNPKTWASFYTVLGIFQANQKYFSGIGIVLGDGITGIDLDHVIDEEGNLDPEAAKFVDAIPGYVERSPSGRGLHILIKGALPSPGERDRQKYGNVLRFDPRNAPEKKEPGIEFYDETSARYLTVTGDVWQERHELNAEDATEAIATAYWKVQKAQTEKKEQERRLRELERQAKELERQEARKGKAIEKAEAKRSLARFDYDDDDALIQRIRSSKQERKFSQLFDRGWEGFYKSASEGVGALLNILAWWTRKDEARMDRIFRRSAMYNPEKWDRPQNGETLGSIELRNACDHCQGEYDPQKPKKEVKNASFIFFPDVTETGSIKATLPNLQALIDYHGIRIFYDEIKKETRITFKDGHFYSMDNYAEAALGELMSTLESEGMPVNHLDQFICAIADRNRINPVKTWIESKHWDGIDRLLPLSDTLITPEWFPDDMKELMIGKWLLSCVVAACHDPWKKPFSTRGVLVLKGDQGIGKTKWILKLTPYPEWVRDGVTLDPSNKDDLMRVLSFWICEFGELETTLNKDMGRLKAFLTKETDQLRVPFARRVSTYARRTVFAASVNKPEFLVDKTGNDRFWVIPVISVKYEHSIDMQQVFAQLFQDWVLGAKWWLNSDESKRLAASNERFEERDEIWDLLTSRIDWDNLERDIELNQTDWMTATEVLQARCGFTTVPSKAQRNYCAAYLRKLTGGRGTTKRLKGTVYPIPRK